MNTNVAFWLPLSITLLLGLAGIWISIKMTRLSSTLADLTAEAKSIKSTVERIENKHFDLTRELATRSEASSPKTIEPIIEKKIKDAFGPLSNLSSTKKEISKFAASTSLSLYADVSGLNVAANTGQNEPSFGEKLLYIIQTTSRDEIRKALSDKESKTAETKEEGDINNKSLS